VNIADKILDYAESLGLDTVATGGGCDYVIRTVDMPVDVTVSAVLQRLNRHIDMVLVSAADAGCSPERLGEPSCVNLWFYRGVEAMWCNGLSIKFNSARKAMKFMARRQIDIRETSPDEWWSR